MQPNGYRKTQAKQCGVQGDCRSNPSRDPEAIARRPTHCWRDRGEFSNEPPSNLKASQPAALRGLGHYSETWHGTYLRFECQTAALRWRVATGLRSILGRKHAQPQELYRRE